MDSALVSGKSQHKSGPIFEFCKLNHIEFFHSASFSWDSMSLSAAIPYFPLYYTDSMVWMKYLPYIVYGCSFFLIFDYYEQCHHKHRCTCTRLSRLYWWQWNYWVIGYADVHFTSNATCTPNCSHRLIHSPTVYEVPSSLFGINFNSCQSGRCKLVLHCGVDLHFPDYWSQIYFNVACESSVFPPKWNSCSFACF